MSLYGSVGASSVRPGPGAHPLAAAPGPSRKRKDRDDPDPRPSIGTKGPTISTPPPFSSPSYPLLGIPRPPPVRHPPPPPPLADQRLGRQVPSSAPPAPAAPTPPAKPGGNRLLMAGYLAHEFLSRGTLFGRPPYGAGAAAVPAPQVARKGEPQQKRTQQYEEVARMLWGGGVHVPGVINPTQLGEWLQKK